MSDSRFYLEVKFDIYGKEFIWSPSLNWYAEPGEIDERITAWFLQCHDEAYAKYQESIREYHKEQAKKETEAEEREQLRKLKEKYE